MIKSTKNIKDAKVYVYNLKGSEVDVLVNLGRNKFARYSGRVSAIYPALFTVVPNGEFNGKTSFSYSELLCGGVRLRAKKSV